MSITQTVLEQYVSALNADSYRVQLKNRLTDGAIPIRYTPQQLLSATSYLRKKNLDGFDIYCRPVGYQYVLLDDLTRNVLADVATLLPCLLLETSPQNYQAWLILPEIPPDRETAKLICQQLAHRFGADGGSAEPDHVGRLPGFTNRKAKYEQANGLYPFVRLHHAKHRLSVFTLCGGRVLQSMNGNPEPNQPAARPQYTGKGADQSFSGQDFGKACEMIRKGKSDADIFNYLSDNSPDLRKRKGRSIAKYLQTTILKAHQAVKS